MEERLNSPGPDAKQRAMEFNAERITDRYLAVMLPGAATDDSDAAPT